MRRSITTLALSLFVLFGLTCAVLAATYCEPSTGLPADTGHDQQQRNASQVLPHAAEAIALASSPGNERVLSPVANTAAIGSLAAETANQECPATVNLAAGRPVSVTVVSWPSTIAADGVSTSTITATVRDADGNLAEDGTMAGFTTTLGTLLYRYVEAESLDVSHSADWAMVASPNASGGLYIYTNNPGAWARWTFEGSAVSVVYVRSAAGGLARILIDGILRRTLDMQAAPSEWQRETVIFNGLDPAVPHLLEVQCLTARVTLDALRSGTTTTNGEATAVLTSAVLCGTANVAGTAIDHRPEAIFGRPWGTTDVLVQCTDLRITKMHFPEEVTAAWNFWAFLCVTNTGSTAATNLVITDTLPDGIAPYSVQPSPGGTFDGLRTITWTIASLGPGFSTQVWVKARPYSTTAGKCLTNLGEVNSDPPGPPVRATDVVCVVPSPSMPPTPPSTPTPTPTPTPRPGTVLPVQGGVGDDNPDTYIYRYAADSNFALEPLLKVGYKQTHAALIRLDLSPIPAGAVIEEVWLELYAVGWSGPAADITIAAHAITPTVFISETTWNEAHRGRPWFRPGCNDVRRDRREVAEFTLTTSGPRRWYRFDLTGLVREWFSGALSNNGVLLRQDAYSLFTYFFASAEYPDVAVRPRLVVRYR